MKICNYCDQEVEQFLPYRDGDPRMAATLRKLHLVGSDIDNYACPHCASTDRERHLKLYLEVLAILTPRLRILHFAPEPRFVDYLATFSPEIHILADISPSSANIEEIDIERIPYASESFDLVIANHVLEHVANVDSALAQINRVLKRDGFAILQTPFSSQRQYSLEDPSFGTPESRLANYGQEDHSRLFGLDIFTRFAGHLEPDVSRHEDVLGDQTAKIYGVNPDEPLFLYKKKGARNGTGASLPAPNRALSVEPVVSIVCITYNHANFIKDAIHSFASQKTTFAVEILVGDDASSDGTAERIATLAAGTCCPVRIFRNERNMGMHRNFANLLAKASGKYVALCEGDDYWVDNEKLQRQVDLLESDPSTVLTYGSVNSIIADQDNRIDYRYTGGLKRDLSPEELKCGLPLNTLTCMFRNVIHDLPDEFYTSGTPDMFLWSLLGSHGGGRYQRELLPSIYRQHPGGVLSSTRPILRLVLDVMTSYSLMTYYRRAGDSGLTSYFRQRCVDRVAVVEAAGDIDSLESLGQLGERMQKMAPNPTSLDLAALSEILREGARAAGPIAPKAAIEGGFPTHATQ